MASSSPATIFRKVLLGSKNIGEGESLGGGANRNRSTFTFRPLRTGVTLGQRWPHLSSSTLEDVNEVFEGAKGLGWPRVC